MPITFRPWHWKLALALGALAIVALLTRGTPTSPRHNQALTASTNDRGVYIRSVSATLNDLAGNVDLELQPAQPILTASTSVDGKEVRATCTQNPNNLDGQNNYLRVVDANANFYSQGVEPGDVIRYYVNLDEESAERGIEQRTAIDLRVRRLDSLDPENALIIENSLTGPVEFPQRIEIWRYSDKRMDAIRSALNRYVARRLPPAGWEPAPDVGALQQIVERANQWIRNQGPGDDQWQPEPLLAELPAELREAKGVAQLIAPENLRNGLLADWEGRLLAQSVWARDIAQWARGSAATDAAVAAALFDWTVRNVQLDANAELSEAIHHPWQALVYGHGNAAHRAWVFAELCRQQGIDAVVLQPAAAGDQPAPLLLAALVDNQLQLFDPHLGIPLPGPSGVPATLSEVAGDDALLRQLDIEGEYAYPLAAGQLQQVAAFVIASPLQLSRRTRLIEQALEGEDFVKLAVDARPLAEKLGQQANISEVRLWVQPFQALADEQSIDMEGRRRAANEFAPFAERPLLWKARVLHFQGNKGVRAEERSDPLAETRDGHLEALKLYQDRGVRPSDVVLDKLELEKRMTYAAGKAAASYWLGLLSYDRGKHDVALSWLGDRTLERAAKGRWANGARYNLARAHEALGNVEEAVRLLRETPKEAPQRPGNLLRARRLELQAAGSADDAPAAEPAGNSTATEPTAPDPAVESPEPAAPDAPPDAPQDS